MCELYTSDEVVGSCVFFFLINILKILYSKCVLYYFHIRETVFINRKNKIKMFLVYYFNYSMFLVILS